MSVSRRTRKLLSTSVAALILSVAGAGLTAPANAAVSGAPSAVREARVAAFNASGVWTIYQSNATVRVDLRQDGNGHLYGSTSSGNTVGTLQEGSVDGEKIFFVVQWNHGPKGRYTGSLGPDRRLSGTTFDMNNPSSQATWRSDRTF
ncbi:MULTISPECIES: hypothetical protein [unclassified Streptomyces]|uniref:hypothetical protein n=1 Tax=unclassified Streptomyces TaxID=2593676 RepID=UPI002250799E|nr:MULTISPECIES: hypothetical protein [unclassified Streptomyces]MCX4528733.1 hypothetical protein [Streptomyces sp. NBC_01551]MCX4540659.1 hypothetical protein [Streptomyces sp. NBC_01565]